MAKISELLIGLLSGAIDQIGQSKLVEVLDKLQATSPEDYKSAIFGGHSLVKRLKPLVEKTGTKIDDLIIGALHEALHTSAKKYGLTLDDDPEV